MQKYSKLKKTSKDKWIKLYCSNKWNENHFYITYKTQMFWKYEYNKFDNSYGSFSLKKRFCLPSR